MFYYFYHKAISCLIRSTNTMVEMLAITVWRNTWNEWNLNWFIKKKYLLGLCMSKFTQFWMDAGCPRQYFRPSCIDLSATSLNFHIRFIGDAWYDAYTHLDAYVKFLNGFWQHSGFESILMSRTGLQISMGLSPKVLYEHYFRIELERWWRWTFSIFNRRAVRIKL